MYLNDDNPGLIGARQIVALDPTEHGPVDGLGQLIPDSVIDQIAEKLVNKADPKFRQILSEEKVKLSEAIKPGIPMAGISVLALLGTHFLIPKEKATLKFVGFAASTAVFFTGAWFVADEMRRLSTTAVKKA